MSPMLMTSKAWRPPNSEGKEVECLQLLGVRSFYALVRR